MVKFYTIPLLLIFLSCLSPAARFSSGHQSVQTNVSNTTAHATVQSWIGCPYLYGGMTRNGVDCSGLIYNLYQDIYGITLPRTTEKQYRLGSYVRKNRLKYGDLVFFKNMRGAGVDHVGMFLGDGRFIHASTSRGVIISDLDESYYRKHYVGGRRIILRESH